MYKAFFDNFITLLFNFGHFSRFRELVISVKYSLMAVTSLSQSVSIFPFFSIKYIEKQAPNCFINKACVTLRRAIQRIFRKVIEKQSFLGFIFI